MMNQISTRKNAKMSAIRARFNALRANLKTLSKDKSGEGYLDMAMKILSLSVPRRRVGQAIHERASSRSPSVSLRSSRNRAYPAHAG